MLCLAMAEFESTDNLVIASRVLRTTLQKSRDLTSAIDKTGPRLESISQTLPSLEEAIKRIARKCSFFAIRGHVDCAIGPAAAVLKVFDAVNGLQGSLSCDPSSDLFRYLSLVKQLEEALKFLSGNCTLVIQWLEDVVQFLKDNTVDDDFYLLNVRKFLKILGELQAMEARSRHVGGPLFGALEKLECEFKHILMENSFPIPFSEQACVSSLPLPEPVIQKLQAIIERLNANNRIEKCVAIYAEVRSSNARATMQALDLDYLDISLSEFDRVQSIEDHIDQWENHLEFAVMHVFDIEHRLCSDVFHKVGSDVWMSCFAKIAVQSGIHNFIKFGNSITKGKKDAIKLLKLLDIFAVLSKLRLHFNYLFGGKGCVEIQDQTRDLIKKVVDGACEIFLELSYQVELQRQSTPPSDGSVPRLLNFVTDFCNQLLEDDYRLILIQVLEIHQIWNYQNFDSEILSKEVYKIMSAIELNLETWSKTYKDSTLSCLFMMNANWNIFKNLKGTNLGDMMGDSWLRHHEQAVEYYATVYVRQSWGKLPALLSEEGSLVFSSNDLVKKRLKSFNEAFDEIYKKQSNWVVLDRGLRVKICELVVRIVVPVYERFMKSYMPWAEQGTSPTKYVKYTVDSLESMIRSMLQSKLGKYDSSSTKCRHLIGKIKNVVTNHFSSSPAAA
ncbi:unnamed protein product [Camellia sinensis]